VVEVAEGLAAQRRAGAAVAGGVDVAALEAWLDGLSFGHVRGDPPPLFWCKIFKRLKLAVDLGGKLDEKINTDDTDGTDQRGLEDTASVFEF
jgi:hypothetical protein